MPLKPIDHTKSLVYKFSKDGNDLYVGSTTSFTKRKSRHKSDCNNPKSPAYNYPVYVYIRANGGWSTIEMVLVQLYPECLSTIELKMYERQHYDILNPQLNRNRPFLYEDERPHRALYDGYSRSEYIKLYNYEMEYINREIQKKIYMENTEGLMEKVELYFLDNTEVNKLSVYEKLFLYLENNYLEIVKENAKS